MKNQLGKLISLRAVIGVSAAFLALACSSSDGGNEGDEPEDNTPVNPNPNNNNNNNNNQGDPGGDDPTLEPPPVQQPDDEPPTLDDIYVESLLRTACGQCHGQAAAQEDNCRAGMCYIESVDELIANGKIVPGNPAQSPLYQRITRTDQTVMPPPGQTERLSPTEIDQIEQFILRKAPEPNITCDNQFLDWDQVYEAVEADLLQQEADERIFIRYVALTDRYNAGVCAQQLEQDRFAMDKFLNSISQENRVQRATEIEDAENSGTIFRIDLRDYKLDAGDGPFVVDGNSFVDGWEAIIGNNNFAIQFQGDQAENVQLQTGTTVPFMFSDAIIDEASFGNLYYELLQLDETRDDIQADLGLDLVADLDEDVTVRAGTTDSLISQQQRVAQRNTQAVGGLYYYESFDLDPDLAGESIFDNPLEFDQNANGSEALFSLPNGLQAYVIFDEAGNRLEESPILFDNITQNDNVMRAGVSCSNCHVAGLVKFDDQVREFVDNNQLDAAAAAAAVGQDFEDITDLYPTNDELQDIFDGDIQLYQRSLGGLDIPSSLREDPIARTFVRFDGDADIVKISGLVGFPADQLEDEVNRLDPDLRGIDNGFRIDMDDFKALYANTLCVVTVAFDNRPADDVCIAAGALIQ